VDNPAHEEEPQGGGKHEMNDSHDQPALNQLPQPWYEKAAQSGNDVPGGTLSSQRCLLLLGNYEATNQNKILLGNSSFRPLHPMGMLWILSLLFQRVHPKAGPFFVVG
tara:strand:- start:42 stop:365 length:324 start_codon:yes stop_codon:yes gene_type:complete